MTPRRGFRAISDGNNRVTGRFRRLCELGQRVGVGPGCFQLLRGLLHRHLAMSPNLVTPYHACCNPRSDSSDIQNNPKHRVLHFQPAWMQGMKLKMSTERLRGFGGKDRHLQPRGSPSARAETVGAPGLKILFGQGRVEMTTPRAFLLPFFQ